MPSLEEKLFEWEDKYKKCQSVDKLRKKLSQLMQEYAWATAIECEKKIDLLQNEKRRMLKSKEKTEVKVQESEEKYKQACEEFNKLKLDLSEIKAKSKEINEKLTQADKNFNEKKNAYKQVQNDLKKFSQQIEKKRQEQKQLRDKYDEEKLKNQKDYQEEKQIVEQKIQAIKNDITKAQASERNKINEATMYAGEVERNVKLQKDKLEDISRIDRSIETLKGEIRTFINSNKDKIYKFGDFMNDLCNDVKRYVAERKFKQAPVGPIGMYIEPVDYKWALAIEQCIGGLVNSFICANYEDERIMHQLISRHVKNPSQRPRIIVNNFNRPRHDITQFVSLTQNAINYLIYVYLKRPSSNEPTVYEMLKFKNDVVANALIDQVKFSSKTRLFIKKIKSTF